MQNSDIMKLPHGLLKKTNLWSGVPGGVVEPNEMGESLVHHNSPISYTVGPSDVFATPSEPYQEGSFSCPSCEAMGKHLEEIPYNPAYPMLAGTFEE